MIGKLSDNTMHTKRGLGPFVNSGGREILAGVERTLEKSSSRAIFAMRVCHQLHHGYQNTIYHGILIVRRSMAVEIFTTSAMEH